MWGLEQASHTLEDWTRAAGAPSGRPVPEAVIEALCDDLNTPRMLAEVHNVRRKAGSAGARDAAAELASALSFLGLSAQGFTEWRRLKQPQILVEGDRIERLVAARSAARARKDWKESDRIRDELAAMGILLKDSKDGTTWEIAR